MKFLFVSTEGLSADIAWRVAREGNEVRFHNEDPEEQAVGSGFFEIVPDWQSHVAWAEIIVLDDVLGKGALAERLRAQGKHVVGGTAYTDRLEDDREFGQEELRKAGVVTIPRWEFSRFSDGAAFVRENPGKYVIKPTGEAQNLKSLLYVGQDNDGADVARVLDDYDRAFGAQEFQLQAHVEGIELGVGAFFNGNAFVLPLTMCVEHKRLFPGDIGPMTGEMGSFLFWSNGNDMFKRTMAKLERHLRGYVGYVDLNCIVNKDGIWPLEWTMRFGYPTFSLQQDGIAMPIGEFLAGLARGTLTTFAVHDEVIVGVRLVIPPWPFNDQGTFKVVQTQPELAHPEIKLLAGTDGVHIEYVRAQEGRWFAAGTGTCILVVTGRGKTVKDAQAQAYARIGKIRIPMMYYRNDIGSKWERDGALVEKWGYLRGGS